MIFTGDAIFEGGAGKFLEGTPLMMHQILYRMLEYEDEAENVKLFYGHDYGWKNTMWMKEVIFSKDKIRSDTSPRLLQLRDKIDAKHERLTALRSTEKTQYSTGNTLKEELELNLFLNIVKEASSHGYEDGENELGLDELGDLIGCQEDPVRITERGVEGIRILRESRSAFDQFVDPIGSKYRAWKSKLRMQQIEMKKEE